MTYYDPWAVARVMIAAIVGIAIGIMVGSWLGGRWKP